MFDQLHQLAFKSILSYMINPLQMIPTWHGPRLEVHVSNECKHDLRQSG